MGNPGNLSSVGVLTIDTGFAATDYVEAGKLGLARVNEDENEHDGEPERSALRWLNWKMRAVR